MNDPDLESLLASLPPRGPSAALRQRVEHELDRDRLWLPPRRRTRPWLPRLLWSGLGAAAAVLAMNLSPGIPDASDPALTGVLPVSTVREVVNAETEGIQYNAESNLPEQRVKLVTIERHAWTDPRDGARITVEMPREDRLVLPASFQ